MQSCRYGQRGRPPVAGWGRPTRWCLLPEHVTFVWWCPTVRGFVEVCTISIVLPSSRPLTHLFKYIVDAGDGGGLVPHDTEVYMGPLWSIGVPVQVPSAVPMVLPINWVLHPTRVDESELPQGSGSQVLRNTRRVALNKLLWLAFLVYLLRIVLFELAKGVRFPQCYTGRHVLLGNVGGLYRRVPGWRKESTGLERALDVCGLFL